MSATTARRQLAAMRELSRRYTTEQLRAMTRAEYNAALAAVIAEKEAGK